MAMLRSRLLCWGSTQPSDEISGGGAYQKLIYTVPAGTRAIVRDIRISAHSTATLTGTWQILQVAGGWTIYLWESPIHATPGGFTDGYQADVVLDPGHILRLSTAFPFTTYWLSGAELTIPA